MVWRLGIMTALWILLVLGSSAAAGIERFTDSQGVIHIRNTGSAKKATRVDPLPQEQLPAVAVNASLPQPAPAPAPSPEPEMNPQSPTVPAASEVKPEATVCQGNEERGATPTAHQVPPEVQPAGTPEPAVQAPLQMVSWPAPDPGPLSHAGTIAPKDARGASNGSIWRYRDHSGILHITNVAPETETVRPASLQARNEDDGRAAPPQRALSEGLGTSPAITKVSLTQAHEGSRASPVRLAAQKPAPAPAPGNIRRYRDARGVLHIENVDPEGPELLPAMMARSSPLGGVGPPRTRPNSRASPDEGEFPAGFPLMKVAWQEGGLALARPKKGKAVKKSQTFAEGTIRRYRDAKGVWHIKSVEPTGPETLPPLEVDLAALARHGIVGRAFGATEPSGTSEAAGSADSLAPNRGASRVIARRDRQGRLKISNLEPEIRIGRAPPLGKIDPVLEPFIQEAAQSYALPDTLIRAVIKVESNFVPWAVSPKGAMGLMQLMPGTAEFLGVQDPFSPRENIQGGCRYLRLLLNTFNGSLPLALAGYNAGFQRVIDNGYQVPPIKETQEFVTQVLERYYLGEGREPLAEPRAPLPEPRSPWPWT